ncbi:hypothetical protein PG984_013966 [Apiospora sp. TS-2023a]
MELREIIGDLASLLDVKDLRPDNGMGMYESAGEFMQSLDANCDKKRLFICCDGTGNNASGTVDPLTNVAKLARAVYRTGDDDYSVPETTMGPDRNLRIKPGQYSGSVRQIVYYSSGVGTRSALLSDSLYSSAFGKDAYCFICNNYNGRSNLDEIILAGFSRGAFTARCLARFINDVGLLRRSGLVFLETLYRLWKKNAGYKPPGGLPREDWPETYRSLHNMREVLKNFFMGPQSGVRIKVLAEWDTVSALWGDPFSFVGNKVPGNVDNAFLALSLHEKRKMFSPMMWDSEENCGSKANIKQCIFAGCHSDIGGGNPDPALASASFFWMIGQIKDCGCKAAFDHDTSTFQFLKKDNNTEDDGSECCKKKHPVGLTVHITVRLLYERRHRVPAVEAGDSRLRCGLFKKFKPDDQGQAPAQMRWVKRGPPPKQILEEDRMGDEEKRLFREVLRQAQDLKKWSPDQELKDEANDCNWTTVNNALRWNPIIKGCAYEQTFIHLLEDYLMGGANGDKSAANGDKSAANGHKSDANGDESAAETEDYNEVVDSLEKAQSNLNRAQSRLDSLVHRSRRAEVVVPERDEMPDDDSSKEAPRPHIQFAEDVIRPSRSPQDERDRDRRYSEDEHSPDIPSTESLESIPRRDTSSTGSTSRRAARHQKRSRSRRGDHLPRPEARYNHAAAPGRTERVYENSDHSISDIESPSPERHQQPIREERDRVVRVIVDESANDDDISSSSNYRTPSR